MIIIIIIEMMLFYKTKNLKKENDGFFPDVVFLFPFYNDKNQVPYFCRFRDFMVYKNIVFLQYTSNDKSPSLPWFYIWVVFDDSWEICSWESYFGCCMLFLWECFGENNKLMHFKRCFCAVSPVMIQKLSYELSKTVWKPVKHEGRGRVGK